ncbi:transposase domain-containing protein [Thermotalea metallivorans]|uniref:transposase domain-containing protein n=1 Tax=Thermotalea metallivorans TaxID=520762 RepID=UPI0038CD9685
MKTVKMNDLNPFYYLKYLLEEPPNTKLTNSEALDHLLPWSETLSEECRAVCQSKK